MASRTERVVRHEASSSKAWRLRTILILVALAAMTVGTEAFACGGCFSPPGSSSLVVQDAERVLFHRDAGGKTTVTIEVRYSGPAKDFAWVVPMPKPPKVGVGTAYVFDRLDQAVAPRFRSRFALDDEGCGLYAAESAFGCSDNDLAVSGLTSDIAVTDGGAHGGGRGGDVQVLEKSQAGPYNYEVVQGKDGSALMKWLADNGYDTPAAAAPIVASHVAKGDVFVAFKLASGADVAEIRPVVLQMQDADPCVPLRLTSIAAADELAVVVYTIGPGRAVPKHHLAVTPNPLRLRWDGGVQNYVQLVAAAIDEAAGRAFVTEFAGPAGDLRVDLFGNEGGVDATALFTRPIVWESADGGWQSRSIWANGKALNPKYFDELDALKTVTTAQGLAEWVRDSAFAVVTETAVLFEAASGLAQANGQGDAAEQFWSTLRDATTLALTDGGEAAVDGAALAESLRTGVAEPVLAVRDALDAPGAKLTRLHMRISADEMDRDPIFAFNATLPDVRIDWAASVAAICYDREFDADAIRLRLEGGPLDGGSWILPNNAFEAISTSTRLAGPTTADPRWKSSPAALRVELLDETGAAKPVPASMVELVDTAIAGAQPGAPSLPATISLAPAAGEASAWSPPADDPHATLHRAAAEAHNTPSEGGCTGGKGGRPFGGAALLLLMAVGTVLAMRLW
ncbi:MAG: DUF2330 domain-containing protein [Deltaproteobacteria bacterium]|nr:DUF2330 domain-containing protein [Deltaproteobacteria bacterium]